MVDGISSIIDTIEVKDDFSFVDTLGSFIGNRGFEETYQKFDEGQNAPQAYNWEVLSAIGNRIGRTIHQNIRDYIDLVSNVDRCKVLNLQSMFNMYGQKFNIIDSIQNYPIEVRNLIDIFSISRKYLLKNDFLNDDFVRELEENGAIVSADIEIEDWYREKNNGHIEFMNRQLVQEKYDLYVKNVFKNLIYGFLNLEYNDFGGTKIRMTLTDEELVGYSIDGYESEDDDVIQNFKRVNNIPPSFNEKKIVDDIDEGRDFLDNYHGLELELLNIEIGLRVKMLTFSGRSSQQSPRNQENSSVEQKTRYSYYRKAKVLEYYRFVDNFFSNQNDISSIQKYPYDQSYFIFEYDTGRKVLIQDETEGYVIDKELVDDAAEILKDITTYITELRERLKLQTRKNYMKGTSNLLIYLINQYIVDYAKTNTHLFEQLSSTPLSSLRGVLKRHSSENVDVIEYFDETEYFNISAATNRDALNGNRSNNRYWQGWDNQTTNQFTGDEINRFYLRDLQLSSDSTVSNLTSFLDIIYNLGANTSYIDKDTGLFTAKISSEPDVYSIILYHQLTSLQFHWDKFQEYILSDWEYEYPKDYISNQISNVVDEYISSYLSVQNLSAVSSVYDKYIDQVHVLSSKVDSLVKRYENFLSDEYQFYFISSDRDYCCEMVDGVKKYNYDFYLNNPDKYTEKYIYDRLTALNEYCAKQDNITFHGLHDTVSALESCLADLSGYYKDGTREAQKPTIFSRISGYGYVDLSSETLNESLDDCEQFVAKQIDERIEYLKSIVQSVLQTARDLRAEYTTLETTFSNALASYDDNNDIVSLTSNELYAFSTDEGPDYHRGYGRKEKPSDVTGYPVWKVNCRSSSEDKTYYYFPQANGKYSGEKVHEGNYPENGTLSEKVADIIKRLETTSYFSWYKEDGEYYQVNLGNRMHEGIYAACTQIKSSLVTIDSSYQTLANTVSSVGITLSSQTGVISKDLDSLIAKLSTIDALKEFADDKTLAELNGVKRSIITLRSSYNPRYYEYQQMPSDNDFSYYLQGFSFDSTSYSFRQLYALSDYIQETDKKNMDKIHVAIDDMFEDHTEIKTGFNEIEISAQQELKNYGQSGDQIENQLAYLETALYDDVTRRTEEGIERILSIMEDVRYHIGFVEDHISDLLSTDAILSDAVDDRVQQLDYRDTDEYTSQLSLYHMYNGLCANSDIYYNYKNVTHPSRQYHPYLWNFIDADQLFSMFQNTLNTNVIQNLEEENIQNYINQYIGQFGQSINIWKNEGIDYTGYSSRYEISEHTLKDRNAKFQKVVDYDGAFFPEAVEYFRKYGADRCIKSIRYGIDKSNPQLSAFYHDYYEPLGLTAKELQAEIDRIETFQTQISAMTDSLPENQVFDIYRYGLDQYDNSYCLFKQYKDSDGSFYDTDRITEKIKKNTPGKLWIRKSAYPFAFPAFSHINGLLDIDSQYTALSLAIHQEMEEDSTNLSGKIYDFEFSRNKSAMVLVVENYTGDIKRFGSANLFVSRISKSMDANNTDFRFVIQDFQIENYERVEKNLPEKDRASEYSKISSLNIDDVADQTASQVINSNMSVIFDDRQLKVIYPSEFPDSTGTPIQNIVNDGGALSVLRYSTINDIRRQANISSILSASADKEYLSGYSDQYVYDFVGCCPKSNTNFLFAFAKKRYASTDDDGNIVTRINLEQESNFKVVNYATAKTSDAGGVVFPRIPTTEDVVISMCDTKQIAFGVLISSMLSDDATMIDAYNLSARVLSSSNSNGFIKSDPFHEEMNSHDVFTSDVFVRKYQVNYDTLDQVGDDMVLNANGDISYLPVYPGKEEIAEFNKREQISANDYFPVELLGQSRNIDDLIEMVNPTPNPYFNMEEISVNNVFGRVYEDYVSDYDKTLKILGNPPINNNVPDGTGVSYNSSEGEFTWEIDLKYSFEGANYTDLDYHKLRVLMFNRNTFGKNPYIVCDLSSSIDKDIVAAYNDDNGGFEVRVNANVDATGTYDNRSVNSLENNRLNNISGISMRFKREGDIETGTRTLKIVFALEDKTKADNTYIDGDSLCLCLMNDRDISMFKYYHYLDAYGIYISAENRDFSMYDDKQGDGYKILYDRDFLVGLSDGFWNYLYDQYGRKTYLRNTDFDKYNYLSDIEVLQGYKKALFKYDEELHFDLSDTNYYYPTVNIKYPKNLAAYAYEKAITMNFADGIDLTSAFGDNELFRIDIPDASSILASIGAVRIDVSSDNSGLLMVDEEVLNNTEKQYSIDDPRVLGEVAMSQDSPSSYIDFDVEKRDIEDVADELREKGFVPLGTESGVTVQTKIVDISNQLFDISKLLRIYVNYKKDMDNGNDIVLYFNYCNYLNTPFIRFGEYGTIEYYQDEDGETRPVLDETGHAKRVFQEYRIFSDIIEGTYLKLGPNESGKLDIVVQFRYFDGGVVRGIKNVKVLSYQIFNISDDKPKFVIKEVYRVGKDSREQDSRYDIGIYGVNTRVQLENMEASKEFLFTVRWNTTAKLRQLKFDLTFDGEIMKCLNPTESGVSMSTATSPSVATITVTNPTKSFIEIPFSYIPSLISYDRLSQPSEVVIDDITVLPQQSENVMNIVNVVNGFVEIIA